MPLCHCHVAGNYNKCYSKRGKKNEKENYHGYSGGIYDSVIIDSLRQQGFKRARGSIYTGGGIYTGISIYTGGSI